jgi:hypothetical protein
MSVLVAAARMAQGECGEGTRSFWREASAPDDGLEVSEVLGRRVHPISFIIVRASLLVLCPPFSSISVTHGVDFLFDERLKPSISPTRTTNTLCASRLFKKASAAV